MSISIPLNIIDGKLEETNDVKKSIEQFLYLLVSTKIGDFVADKDFGFTFPG